MVVPSFAEFVCADVIFVFDVYQFLLFLVHIHPFECLIRLIVEHDQIPIANVETGQMIAGIFRIENIFVHNECGASCLRCVSPGIKRIPWIELVWTHMLWKVVNLKRLHSNLSDRSVFAEDVIHFVWGDFVWQITYVQHTIHFGRQSNLKTTN